MTGAEEWVIEVREDVGSPWISAAQADVDSRVYASKRDAQRQIRELRQIGMLGAYDAVRAVKISP